MSRYLPMSHCSNLPLHHKNVTPHVVAYLVFMKFITDYLRNTLNVPKLKAFIHIYKPSLSVTKHVSHGPPIAYD